MKTPRFSLPKAIAMVCFNSLAAVRLVNSLKSELRARLLTTDSLVVQRNARWRYCYEQFPHAQNFIGYV